jgi:tRNA(Ile)-lysidine synthase
VAAASPALTEAAFFARLQSLNLPEKFAVAVSGGRDSMALARLCAAWAAKTGAKVIAFTVDHGLRPAAAAEASKAKAWCEAIGVEHVTLRWEGEKPSSGLQAAARSARYTLLIEAAEAHGCCAILTAHSEDDQAETLFMRLSRGAGLKGLAAMREESNVAAGPGEAMRLLRPLLAFSRQSVTAYLNNIGQDYLDDPSNIDPQFERVRVRALLAALAEQGLLTAPSLAASAEKLRLAEEAARAQEDALLDRLGGCFYGWGGVSLDRWEGGLPGAAGLARRLIHAAGGGDYAPDEAGAAETVEKALSERAATLGGALVRRHKDRLWFLREPAALTGRAGVAPLAPVLLSRPLLWDRRFVIEPLKTTAQKLEVAPMGSAAASFLGSKAGLFRGPPEALAALPGLMRQGVLIDAPALPFINTENLTCRPLVKERFEGRIVRFS